MTGAAHPLPAEPYALAHALAYAALGWPVLALAPGEKRPDGALAPHGFKDATTDPATIARWFAQVPGAGVGIHPGPAGLLVLDLDDKPGKPRGADSLAALEAEHGALPATLTQRTPSGGQAEGERAPVTGNQSTKPTKPTTGKPECSAPAPAPPAAWPGAYCAHPSNPRGRDWRPVDKAQRGRADSQSTRLLAFSARRKAVAHAWRSVQRRAVREHPQGCAGTLSRYANPARSATLHGVEGGRFSTCRQGANHG